MKFESNGIERISINFTIERERNTHFSIESFLQIVNCFIFHENREDLRDVGGNESERK